MKGFRWVLLVLLVGLPAQSQNLYKQFEYVTVEGRVVARDGTPIQDCNVEIRVLSNQGTQMDRTPDDDSIPTGWGQTSGNALGTNTFDVNNMKKAGWGKTDKSGHFSIEGIPSPGDYVLSIKGMKGFKKTQMPLRVDNPKDTVMKVPDIVMDPFNEMDSKTKKLLNKAANLLNDGSLEEAESILNEINQRDDSYSEVYVSLGNICMKRKDAAGAYKAYARAFDLGEHNPQICKLLMKFSFGKQEFDRTVSYVEALLVQDPADLNAVYLAGVCHYNLHQFEQAEPYFAHFLEKKGDLARKDPSFMYAFGMTEVALNKPLPASEYLHAAYRLGWKANPEFLKDLANQYIEQKRYDEAKAVLGDLLEKFPEFKGREDVESIYNKLP